MSRWSTLKGYVSIHRKIVNWRWYPAKLKRKYTKYEAFLELILMANHNEAMVGDTLVEVGATLTSQKELAERWKWSRVKVRKFIESLSTFAETFHHFSEKGTYLKLRRYATYQNRATPLSQKTLHQNDTNNNYIIKKGNFSEKENKGFERY